jgi:hypothetical protein
LGAHPLLDPSHTYCYVGERSNLIRIQSLEMHMRCYQPRITYLPFGTLHTADSTCPVLVWLDYTIALFSDIFEVQAVPVKHLDCESQELPPPAR